MRSINLQSSFHVATNIQRHDPYAQWKKTSNYIRSYIAIHPSLPLEKKCDLLSFNAQYLVKISEYSLKTIELEQRNISPLRKKSTNYHRFYTQDNRLLRESSIWLKFLFPNGYSFIVSNSAYKIYFKNFFHSVRISCEDDKEKIKIKLESQLDIVNKRLENIFKDQTINLKVAPFHILIELNADDFQKAKEEMSRIYLHINQIIGDYDFTTTELSNLFLENLTCIAIYPCWERSTKVLICSTHECVQQIRSAGSTPSLQQIAKIYVKALEIQKKDFYQEAPKGLADFHYNSIFEAFPIVNKLKIVEMIDHELINQLKALCKNEQSNLKQIVGQAIIKIIEGFYQLNVEDEFQSHGIMDLLSDSIARINNYLAQLVQDHTTYSQFEDCVDLIIEEVILILTLAKPYTQGQLERIIAEQMVHPWPIPNFVRLTSGGSQCIMEILAAFLTINKKSDDPTHIFYFNDIYFENCVHLSELNEINKHVNALPVFVENKYSFEEQIGRLLKKDVKLNALFIDIHSSAQVRRWVQKTHNVIEILETLLSEELLKNEFFCCIDNTIGYWGSEEINQILNRFQKEIRSGQIHFIIYRSAHKLDIFGCDKFNGGNYLVYGDNQSNLCKSLVKTQISLDGKGVDYQAYTHFYMHAKELMQAYFKKIVENTNLLYSLLDQSFIWSEGKEIGSFWISQKEDVGSSYIEIASFKAQSIIKDFYEEKNKLGILKERDSFGYRETTLLNYEGDGYNCIRITCGLEEEETIIQYANFINQFFQNVNYTNENNN